jgi:hypothetical protein
LNRLLEVACTVFGPVINVTGIGCTLALANAPEGEISGKGCTRHEVQESCEGETHGFEKT